MTTPPSAGTHVLLVAAGSAVGAVLRFLLDTAAGGGWAALWTLNLAGAALLGLLTGLLAGRRSARWLAPLLGPGLLGGFTTFSAVLVLTVGSTGPVAAVAQLGAMTLLGALAAWAGLVLARRLHPHGDVPAEARR
ncbi:CrcB family protein [Desertihabitans brevis]|uniref:Fluoride-specific ion channel FluC n=1 Tax=Desertihabitans brevis TaxID=2268447 RepID=A0A367YTM0_9ACTN|nr:CrcB family protein [Desertihabitans brevis]RCK69194.1 CrcB family protein [Desertihabitans brevis]